MKGTVTISLADYNKLVKKYPNDYELGGAIRKYITIKNNTKYETNTSNNFSVKYICQS